MPEPTLAPGRTGGGLAPGELVIVSERTGATHRICPAGELDLATSHRLERELLGVEQTDASGIDLDLGGLTFIDTAGIHVLCRAAARSRIDGSRLRLRRGRPAVQRVLAIAGVDRTLPFASFPRPVGVRGRGRGRGPTSQPGFVTEWTR
jgi:anti-sigma B factor antagonist